MASKPKKPVSEEVAPQETACNCEELKTLVAAAQAENRELREKLGDVGRALFELLHPTPEHIIKFIEENWEHDELIAVIRGVGEKFEQEVAEAFPVVAKNPAPINSEESDEEEEIEDSDENNPEPTLAERLARGEEIVVHKENARAVLAAMEELK